MKRFSMSVALTAPLALALAACGGEAGDDASGDVIPAIEAPEGTNWTETVTVSDAGGYILGNPEAPVKLVEYASHTCPACANFAATGKPGIKEYVATGVVSFEQREVFLNPFDVVIAGLAQCGPKERFQPISDEVWSNLNEIRAGWGPNEAAIQAAANQPIETRFVALGDATGLIDFVSARGVSANEARACLGDAEKMEAMVESVTAASQAANITGTPTFLLNGNRIEGISWTDVEPALQRAGARKAE